MPRRFRSTVTCAWDIDDAFDSRRDESSVERDRVVTVRSWKTTIVVVDPEMDICRYGCRLSVVRSPPAESRCPRQRSLGSFRVVDHHAPAPRRRGDRRLCVRSCHGEDRSAVVRRLRAAATDPVDAWEQVGRHASLSLSIRPDTVPDEDPRSVRRAASLTENACCRQCLGRRLCAGLLPDRNLGSLSAGRAAPLVHSRRQRLASRRGRSASGSGSANELGTWLHVIGGRCLDPGSGRHERHVASSAMTSIVLPPVRLNP